MVAAVARGRCGTQPPRRRLRDVRPPDSSRALPGGSLLLWTSAWIWLAALAASPVIDGLFPDGRLLSRRWAGVVWLTVASMTLAMATIAVAAWPLRGPALLEGPSGDRRWTRRLPCPLGPGPIRGGRGRLIDRHGDPSAPGQGRRTPADQLVPVRRHHRHLGHYRGSRPWRPDHHRVVLGGMVVPFAIAVVLFKYRLYDIDRLINRTLVYGCSPPCWPASMPAWSWSSGRCSAR